MELSQGPEEEASKEFVRANLSIQIHSIIHKAQKSHGLVSNDTSSDFTSYRSYLTNRISRLRHSKPVHKRTSGHAGKKHAYRKKEYSIEDANQHENFILIPLAIAERAWAHAMEIKNINQMTMQSGGKKNYYVKRLKKAVKHVAELEYYVNEICDENTMLETKCYAAFIRGTFYCESKDWKVCILMLHFLRIIWLISDMFLFFCRLHVEILLRLLNFVMNFQTSTDPKNIGN